jgi:hypothetical protein
MGNLLRGHQLFLSRCDNLPTKITDQKQKDDIFHLSLLEIATITFDNVECRLLEK